MTAIYDGVLWNLSVAFISISWTPPEVEGFFMCLLDICVVSLETDLLLSLVYLLMSCLGF